MHTKGVVTVKVFLPKLKGNRCEATLKAAFLPLFAPPPRAGRQGKKGSKPVPPYPAARDNRRPRAVHVPPDVDVIALLLKAKGAARSRPVALHGLCYAAALFCSSGRCLRKNTTLGVASFTQSSTSSRPTLARPFRLWALFSSSKSKTSCQREVEGLNCAALAAIRPQLVGAIAEAADRVLAEKIKVAA